MDDEIESVLFIAREVMVYQIPPLKNVQGHKAAEWDVEQFVWKGRLRVMEIGSRCEIRLEDSTTGELFAQVNYAPPWTQVEPVLDSSRYFVFRVEGEGGKRASIGCGFQERADSFDFNVALQSVSKRSENPSSSNPTSGPPKPPAPPKDYSLKEGQTFKIKIPGRDGKRAGAGVGAGSAAGGGASGAGGGGMFSLPPPPPPGRR